MIDMKRVIYKYDFRSDYKFVAPRGDVRLVAHQHSNDIMPTVWIEHSVGVDSDAHEYIIVGTGQQFDHSSEMQHVGSAVCGQYVWHVYRRSVS